jgi:hypothetical protein
MARFCDIQYSSARLPVVSLSAGIAYWLEVEQERCDHVLANNNFDALPSSLQVSLMKLLP